MAVTAIEENYEISSFLKEFGFFLIYNSLIIDKKSSNYEFIGKRMMKSLALCDNVENMLNLQSLLGYLKKVQIK